MYTPSLRVKRNGVPILKKTEIDVIGERFVKDFQPDVLTNPSPVDIEGFIEFYLGMTPDFQYLSHNGVYLGMTVFNDTNKVPVYDPATNRAEYISAKARTVIIDNRLLDENQRHRFRLLSVTRVGMTSSTPAIFPITRTRQVSSTRISLHP